jgi:hypothetical protein
VIDISDPANPAIGGACDTPGSALGVYVAGSHAYVADGESGLQVIGISDPANPAIGGACDTPGYANGVYVAGSYAYVADGSYRLQVIEKFSPLTEIQYVDSGTLIATVAAGYRPGTYNLHVTNPDGGHTVLYNAFTSFENEVGIKMALPAGWSMISLPVRPDVATVATLFPEAVVVYRYQKGAGYVRVEKWENLEAGIGYWILLDEPQSYVITGTAITEYTMPVQDGWYMIGGCSMPAHKMVTSGKIDGIYGYTQCVGFQGLLGSEPLERGKGYWILFSDTTEGAEFTANTSISE